MPNAAPPAGCCRSLISSLLSAALDDVIDLDTDAKWATLDLDVQTNTIGNQFTVDTKKEIFRVYFAQSIVHLHYQQITTEDSPGCVNERSKMD